MYIPPPHNPIDPSLLSSYIKAHTQPIYVIQPCFERAYKENVYVQRKLLVLNITKQRWKRKLMVVIDMTTTLEDGMKWR